jgi:ribosomal protein S18 acetylase RimI-like enzyme
MPDFVIRKATLEDAGLLANLNVPIHRIHSDALPQIFRPITANDPGIIAFFTSMLQSPDDTIHILEVEGVPAGYVHTRIIRNQTNPFAHAHQALRVDAISVSPEFQGQGYGKELMEIAKEQAKTLDIQRIVLDVWAFNEQAQEFYASLGFETYRYQLEMHLDE